jgi:uncharacterized protein (DUF302 family)
MRDVEYSMRRELPGVDFEDALERVSEALSDAGFGILTEIDVKATLKEKLDEEFKSYRILGACNPGLAHRALTADDNIGLLLPCNVVVSETSEGSEVAFLSPVSMLSVAGNDRIMPVA